MSEKVYGPAALKRAQVLVLSSRDEFVRCGRRGAGALIWLDVINVRNRFPPRTTVVLRACMWPHAAKPISQMRHPPGFEDGTREAHSSPRLRAGRRPVVRPDRAGGLPRREESLPRPRPVEPRPGTGDQGPSTQSVPSGMSPWVWLLLIVIAGAATSTAYVLRRRMKAR